MAMQVYGRLANWRGWDGHTVRIFDKNDLEVGTAALGGVGASGGDLTGLWTIDLSVQPVSLLLSLEDQAGTVIGRRRLECAGDLAEILPSDFAASLVSEEVR